MIPSDNQAISKKNAQKRIVPSRGCADESLPRLHLGARRVVAHPWAGCPRVQGVGERTGQRPLPVDEGLRAKMRSDPGDPGGQRPNGAAH